MHGQSGRGAILARIVIGLAILFTAASGASASVWQWGCQGQLGGQQITFNRESMVIVDSKVKMGDVRTLRMTKMELPPGSPPHVHYTLQAGNTGLDKSLDFTRVSDDKRKAAFTELPSKQISHKARLVCGRDETIDVFRKVYRFVRENEPPRTIIMQCMEYQLSTRGGRPGCDQ